MKKIPVALLIMTLMSMPVQVYGIEGQMSQSDVIKSFEKNDSSSAESMADMGSSLTIFDTDLNSVFDMMTNSLVDGKDVSFSSVFNQMGNFSISTDSYLDTSSMQLSDGTDFGIVNLQYCSLAEKMIDQFGDGSLSGQSQGCLSLFNNTYGDIVSEIQLEEPTIPEGFDVNSMLESSQNAVDSAYSQATSSGSFASIKNSISIGKVFSLAKKGLSMPSLASTSDLQGMIKDSTSSQKKTISGEYDTRRTWINEKRNDVKQNTASNLSKNLLNTMGTYAKMNIFEEMEKAAKGSSDSDTKDTSKSSSKEAKAANKYVAKAIDGNNGKTDENIITQAYYYYVTESDNVAESTRNKVKAEGIEKFCESDQNKLTAQTWYSSTTE